MSQKTTQAPESAQKRLYVRMNCDNEYAELPAFAVIQITDRLVADVLRLQGVCEAHQLAGAEIWDYSVLFAPMRDGEDFRSDTERLSVTSDSFQYVGYEKHTGLYWSTMSVTVAHLRAIVADTSGRTEWFGSCQQDSDWEELEEEVRGTAPVEAD